MTTGIPELEGIVEQALERLEEAARLDLTTEQKAKLSEIASRVRALSRRT